MRPRTRPRPNHRPKAASRRGPLRSISIAIAACCALAHGASAQQVSGEVGIELAHFGVGGYVRPMSMVGVRLVVSDAADRQREVLIRLDIKDPDGDVTSWQRTITTNPGVRQPVWLYLRAPPRLGPGQAMTVSAFEAVEREVAPDRFEFVPGRALGVARIAPQQVIDRRVGLFAVIGRGTLGLAPYEVGLSPVAHHLALGHERTAIVRDLAVDDLPDAWQGLEPIDVIVWSEGAPTELGVARAEAIREWVNRGGHLVIVLPPAGQAWSDRVNNPLAPILPQVTTERTEDVSYEPYRSMLSKQVLTGADLAGGARPVPLPTRATVHSFEPAPGDLDTHRILLGPDGRCVVVRRVVGTGAVTFIGLDLRAPALFARGLPDPEVFWHRILGRRGLMLSPEQVRASNISSLRETYTLDRDVRIAIAKRQRAGAGVLLGLVVFVAYWLLAGPIGFMLLKRSRRTHHAWVAFLGTAGVFTAIAWGGASVIRPSRVEAQHLTVIEHVYGQPVQRAVSWLSVLVPTYGEATLRVGEPPPRDARPGSTSNLLSPWEPGGSEGVEEAVAGFPDARAYAVASRHPDSVRFPTRATVKQFRADWSGGPRLAMPRPVVPAGDTGGRVIRIVDQQGGTTRLSGSLVHNLPEPLENVQIMVVRGQLVFARSLAGATNSPMLASIDVYNLAGPWPADVALDLAAISSGVATNRNRDFLVRRAPPNLGSADGSFSGASSDHMADRLRGASLIWQLPIPDVRMDRGWTSDRDNEAYLRSELHGWDLGRWFTQPCLIITGSLPTGATPVPLVIDSGGGERAVASGGLTFVRWIYPLADDPPRAEPDVSELDAPP